MNYLQWDEVHPNDLIYDTKEKEDVLVCSKFYNVYCQKMFTGESKSCNAIIRPFEDDRYLKGGESND